MKKGLFITSGFLGMVAVLLGAFGAHGLKPHLDTYQIAIYEKAVFYQFIHVLASLVSLILYSFFLKKGFLYAGLFFIIGILFFSGSLYLLAIKDLIAIPTNIIGPVTPIGGLFFVLGWATIFINSLSNSK
jgi:uncharacterized membrane protein YgdD (TMEM256/DUF423 family)